MINPWSHDVASLTCFEASASHFATKTPNILCCRRHHRWSFDLCHLAFLVCGPAEEELRCGAASTNPSREHQLNPVRNFKIVFLFFSGINCSPFPSARHLLWCPSIRSNKIYIAASGSKNSNWSHTVLMYTEALSHFRSTFTDVGPWVGPSKLAQLRSWDETKTLKSWQLQMQKTRMRVKLCRKQCPEKSNMVKHQRHQTLLMKPATKWSQIQADPKMRLNLLSHCSACCRVGHNSPAQARDAHSSGSAALCTVALPGLESKLLPVPTRLTCEVCYGWTGLEKFRSLALVQYVHIYIYTLGLIWTFYFGRMNYFIVHWITPRLGSWNEANDPFFWKLANSEGQTCGFYRHSAAIWDAIQRSTNPPFLKTTYNHGSCEDCTLIPTQPSQIVDHGPWTQLVFASVLRCKIRHCIIVWYVEPLCSNW